MKVSSSGPGLQPEEGDKKSLNSELWHACAGPLVSLPSVGSRVVYFPQGHSEQVAASTNKEVDPQIPNYPNLLPQLICQLHDVAMHVDVETDEVYAQMTLQPLSPEEQKEAFFPADLGAPSKQPTNYFCKTLTASDTSTHGGFSVPRRSAEKVFPPLEFSQQPPAQELIARDLHDNVWKFRHIFRGQPKRHLLTTGWSVFVSAKKLVAGDSVLFIWNDNNQLLLGIRRANRPQTVMPSSVLSSDSMHIGLLAAAAHAAATNSRFTVFYNPRASNTVFVIPLAKYAKAVYHTHMSIGMRFRMLFETEESSVRRYMGTITGVSDLDPRHWPNSHWRSVKVGWDESTAGENQTRVSLWDIEPLTTFPMYPLPFTLGLKRSWLPDMAVPSINFQIPGSSSSIQSRLDVSILDMEPKIYQPIAAAALQGHSKRASSSILQFQQPLVVPNGAVSLLPSQSLQHMLQPQQEPLEITQERQVQTKMQSQLFKPEMQNHEVFYEQQQLAWQQQQWLSTQHQLQQQVAYQRQPQKQQPEEHHVLKLMSEQQYQQPRHPPSNQRKSLELLQKYLNQNQVDHVVPTSLQFASPRLPTNFHMQNNISESGNNPLESSNTKPMNGILGTVSSEMPIEIVSSSTWLPERIGVDNVIPYGSLCNSPKMEQLGQSRGSFSQPSIMSPPFLQSEGLAQEVDFSEHNNILLGVHANSPSLLSQNGVANSSNFIGRTDSVAFPFIASSFTDNVGSDFSFSSAIAISNCLDESGFSRSTDNGGQVEPPAETFVKVYKSGSFGRSLDISKFNSYPELRSELGRMFGLDGQLEDPLRSGWQLVFVDQENDVLLVGDDPWQEFVNSVGHIKILSPQEVQQMGKPGDELLNDLPTKYLSSSGCDEYVFRQDSRNLSSGIMSVGSLDY